MLKKSYTFFSFILFTFAWCISSNIYGQEIDPPDLQNIYDVAPKTNTVPADTAPPANFPYPELFSFHYSTNTTINGGTVGAMYFSNNFYFNRWNGTTLYLYDGGLNGPQNLVNTLTYQGYIRDLTTDGTFLYGAGTSAGGSSTIHRMDANGISQGTITSAGGIVRAIAYSPDENAFFVSDFSNNIGVINATTGALIRTLTGTSALAAKYGMAYSTAAQVADGPYLWVWGQGTNADPYNKLWKINPQTGAVIDTYQFGPLPPGATSPLGIAGGAEICQIADRWVLLLNYQNFELEGYDLGPVQVVGPGYAADPNPANGATDVEINADLSWTNPAGAASIEVFFGTDAGNLTSVYSGAPVTTFDPGALQYFTQYFWRVNETDTSGTTVGFTWNFTTRLAGPGPATNPNPANGANNVDLNADLIWTNPAGATSIEVFFGTSPGSMNSVYSGVPVTTWDPGLSYGTNYYWRVDETDATGTFLGTVWNFTTMLDPNAPVLVVPSDYTNVPGTATFLGPLYTSARTYQLLIHEDLLTSLIDKDIQAVSWRIPTSATADWPPSDITVTDYNIFLSGSVPPANRDLTNFAANVVGMQVLVRSGSLFIPANSYTFGNVPNNWGPEIIFNTGYLYAGGHLLIEIRLSGTGNSRNTDALGTSTTGYGSLFSACWGNGLTANSGSQGNFTIVRLSAVVIPVELTSFSASVVDGRVNLNWQTASETNNYGFEVERKTAGQKFAKVGFVAGYGTTTETKNYSFVDNSAASGSYTYRLKQVDFDGTFEYSNEVEADLAPSSYSLAQNYPNPFNPNTKIDFSLASDSKVTLKIFDILGQEVRTLLNGNLAAQSHSIEFNASSLNSGVYFYTLEAKGVDGSNFTSTKKMILTK